MVLDIILEPKEFLLRSYAKGYLAMLDIFQSRKENRNFKKKEKFKNVSDVKRKEKTAKTKNILNKCADHNIMKILMGVF